MTRQDLELDTVSTLLPPTTFVKSVPTCVTCTKNLRVQDLLKCGVPTRHLSHLSKQETRQRPARVRRAEQRVDLGDAHAELARSVDKLVPHHEELGAHDEVRDVHAMDVLRISINAKTVHWSGSSGLVVTPVLWRAQSYIIAW